MMNGSVRRFILRLGSLLMVMVLMTGCTLPEVNKVPTFVLRLVTDLPKESQGYAQLERFGELVSQQSGQGMAVKIYAKNEWSKWESFYDHLSLNTVELVCLSTGQLSALVPQYELYGLPCLFTDERAVSVYAAGEKGTEALALLTPLGYQGLGFVGNGYDYIVHSKEEPIVSASDWAGLQMVASEAPFYGEGLRLLGISRIDPNNPLLVANSWSVDSAEVKSMIGLKKINEGFVVNDPKMFYGLGVVFADGQWWEGLSKERQTLLTECFSRAQEETMADYGNKNLSDVFTEGGVRLEPLSEQVQSAIYQATRTMVNNYLSSGLNSLATGWVSMPVTP